jgi:hypothetical protein
LNEAPDEPARKGRSNAILTYETVELLNLGIQKALLGIEHLTKKLDDEHALYIDHEARLRILEKAEAGRSSSTGSIKFLYQAIWPAAAFGIALLNYLK